MRVFGLTTVLTGISAFNWEFNLAEDKRNQARVVHEQLNLSQPWNPVRAISFGEGHVDYASEEQVVALSAARVNFMDVTDEEKAPYPVRQFGIGHLS